MQRSDSPARNIPGLFLGDPSSGFRMIVDLTFTAYKVFALIALPVFLALWLVLPAAVIAVGAGYVAARLVVPHLPASVRRPWFFGGMVVAFLLLLIPSVRFWANGLVWWQALLIAPAVGVVLTRWVMPRIGNNTPISYWLSVLPRVAGGPRRRREIATYAPSSPPAEETLHPLQILALTLDPKEVTVQTALPKVKPVEFAEWRPNHPASAARTLAWVASKGAGTNVRNDSTLEITEGVGFIPVRPGMVIVHDGARFSTHSSMRGFEAQFEVQS